MADNYLEKRMEEYRAGKLAPKSRVVVHAAGAKREPGDFTLSFPKLNAVVIGGPTELAGMFVRIFRGVDASVALCHSDSKRCTPLAQASGCRYYPFDPADVSKLERVIDDVTARWGGADVVVDLRGVEDEAEGDEAAALAELVMIHAHPKFGFVRRTDIEFDE